jgi:NADPH2:quinone reductase
MSLAVQIDQHGGPEQLKLVDVTVGQPGPGEIRIRHKAIGLNFIDVYQRSGLYTLPMPLKLGMEASGIVEAVGEGVTHLKVGDRAAYASQPPGSYCEERVMPAKCVCKLPDDISFETGAAMMLKGLTAQYLLMKTRPVEGLQAGDHVLFHAAAGGVGLIACQWGKALGFRMIGTAGSDAKCQLAIANGAEHCINYSTDDFLARVKEITGGKGLKVVYDSVGKDTWDKSLDCLRPFGLMATFGNASGAVPPFAPGVLGVKGSLYVTRQTLFSHITTRESTQAMADDLFKVVQSGQVKIHIDQTFPLAQGSHADATKYAIEHNRLVVTLKDGSTTSLAHESQFVGFNGEAENPTEVVLLNNGLHVIIDIDANSPIGKTDAAGVKDLTLEAAITTIQDLEDSVAAVDAEEKVEGYRNWLGLMKGDLQESIEKNGKTVTRALNKDRTVKNLIGGTTTLHGRSLMLLRNVGHLMTNPAILVEGEEVFEYGGLLFRICAIGHYDNNNIKPQQQRVYQQRERQRL